jgi:hypothetical protein
VVGERTTAATAYLVLTSRLLDKQASLAVKGHSASGKSFTVEQTVRFFPPEAVITMTAMSQRALVYSTEQYAHRTLVVYEAVALREGVEDDLTSYFIRSLLSEGRIEYPVTVRDKDGSFTTKTIVKEGPTNLVVTTTRTQIHAENETRMLSVTTDDSRDQTARVLQALAVETAPTVDLEEWVTLQRWLAAHGERRVTIPYAATLARLIPPVAVRLRRDFGTVLALIRAHAMLHQCSRKRDESGRVIATSTTTKRFTELSLRWWPKASRPRSAIRCVRPSSPCSASPKMSIHRTQTGPWPSTSPMNCGWTSRRPGGDCWPRPAPDMSPTLRSGVASRGDGCRVSRCRWQWRCCHHATGSPPSLSASLLVNPPIRRTVARWQANLREKATVDRHHRRVSGDRQGPPDLPGRRRAGQRPRHVQSRGARTGPAAPVRRPRRRACRSTQPRPNDGDVLKPRTEGSSTISGEAFKWR